MATENQTVPQSRIGWKPLVGAAVVVVVGMGVGCFFGWIRESVIGLVLAGAFAATLAGIALNAAFSRLSGLPRAGGILLAALIVVVCLYPAREMIAPGSPEVEGRVSLQSPELALKPGSWRLLVSSHLSAGSDATVSYILHAGSETLEGTLERVMSRQRAGRRGSIEVVEDHDIVAHEVTLRGGDTAVRLDTLSGRSTTNDLLIRAYPALPSWTLFAVIGALVALGIALEAKFKARSAFTMTAVAALCFGLLIRTASLGSTIGPVVYSALLAAGGGALGGSLLSGLIKRVGKPPEKAVAKA